MNEFLEMVYSAIDEKLGVDIKVIDISEISVLADYFVIAHGNNTPQIQAIVENIDFRASKLGIEPKNIEGGRNGGWTLLDYGHTIIHIFGKDERLFYDLERLWIDGKPILKESIPTETVATKEPLMVDTLEEDTLVEE